MSSSAALRADQFYPKADTPIPDAELRSLAKSGDRISEDQARGILDRAGVHPTGVRRLATGTFHELFTVDTAGGEPLVLKVTRVTPSGGGLEVEAAVTVILRQSGVPAVPVLQVGDDGDAQWSLTGFAEGPSLRAVDDDEGAVTDALPLLAHHLRGVHAIPASGWGLLAGPGAAGTRASWADYLLLRLEEHLALAAIDDSTADRVREVLERVARLDPGPAALLHGDVGPHNTILGDDLRLIDWEDALAGDPAFDVAMWATFNPVRRWPVFFAAYHDAGWQPDFRFWAYFLRISLAKAVVRVRFDYRDVPGREPASARIPRALEAIAELPEPHE